MTEEEKAKLAEAEKAKVEFEASLEGLSDEEKTQKRTEKETAEQEASLQAEHEAELKRERERTAAAEKAAADASFKLREQRRKEKDDEDGDDDEDKPLTAKQLEATLQKERDLTRKELQAEAIAEKARKLSRSESEANLIIEIHKNRTFPAGMSLDEQVEEAFAIANRKSLIAQNEELKRALKSKETASHDAAGTYRDAPPISEPVSSNDLKALKASGFVWDGKSGTYIKKIGKNFVVYDPKTKTSRRVAGQ